MNRNQIWITLLLQPLTDTSDTVLYTTEHVNCVAKSDSSQAIHCPGKFASLDPCSVDSAKNFCGVKIVIPSKNIKGCIRGWTIPINRAPCHQKHLVKYELEHHNIAYEHAFTSCPLVSVYEAHPWLLLGVLSGARSLCQPAAEYRDTLVSLLEEDDEPHPWLMPKPPWSEMNELFGFRFESFPRISNIRIPIRQFFSPNIIRIFESFSLNLKYLKHFFMSFWGIWAIFF